MRCSVFAFAAVLAVSAVAPMSVQAQIFMSPEEANKVGKEEHPKILKEFGGVYEDPNIGAYVAGIAGRIAGQSGQPASSFTFTVLNSPIVNAFALPGGYVYITRGTLALANNEAEAAGVLGHEIGHVIAHHSEKRYDKSIFTNLGVAGASILGSIFLGSGAGDLIGQAGQLGGGAYLASFSRENELEADTIGVKLLARVGYAPDAQAAFLQSLSDYGALESRKAGQAGKDRMNDLFATHPGGPQRVKEAMAAAKEYPNSPVYRRDEYLDRLDGLIYGDDPKEGVVRGTTFTHPDLRLSFTAPDGWRISNTSNAVVAIGSGGRLQFDIEGDKRKVQASRSALDYLTRVWVPNLRLSNAEAIKVNGMPAATGSTRLQQKNGSSVDARFVAVGFPTDDILRFVIIAPAGGLSKIEPTVIRSVNTLRHLSESEARAVKPVRVKVVTVKSGDTVEGYAKSAPLGQYAAEELRLLNALPAGQQPKPGERFKTVE